MSRLSLWARLDRHPPVLLRLLARLPKSRPLESTEIAERSGLSVMQVEAISHSTSWAGIDIPTARSFMIGCCADITDRKTYKRIREFLKHQQQLRNPVSKFEYLQRSPKWESYYLPLVRSLANHLKKLCREKSH